MSKQSLMWLNNNFFNESLLVAGFPLFSSDKIPWHFPDFSSIFFIFPWLLLNIIMAFIQYLVFLCMASIHYWIIVLKVYMH